MVRIAVCDGEKVDLEYLAEEIQHGCSGRILSVIRETRPCEISVP